MHKTITLAVLFLIASLTLYGCTEMDEEIKPSPETVEETEVDKDISDLEVLDEDLDMSDLDSIEKDLSELDW